MITSNLSIAELEERWRPEGVTPGAFHEGMRVTDRLRESWGEQQTRGREPAGGEPGRVSGRRISPVRASCHEEECSDGVFMLVTLHRFAFGDF